MKLKSLFLILACLGYFQVRAQRSEVNAAENQYQTYVQLRTEKNLPKALESLHEAQASIDKATVHEKTKDNPKMLTYRAMIYGELALLENDEVKSEALIGASVLAYRKAIVGDKDDEFKENIKWLTNLYAQYESNTGVKDYKKADYENAYKHFNNSLVFLPGDTTLTYYAASAALNYKNYKDAANHYEKLLTTNYSNNKQIYPDLAQVYTFLGDTSKAFATTQAGLQKFPDNQDLLLLESELAVPAKKTDQVIARYEASIQTQPDNKWFPYYLAIVYENVGNQTKAEEAYRKALSIDVSFFKATLGLSTILLRKAVDSYNVAARLPSNTKKQKLDQAMAVANKQFEEALPFLEKAVSLNPKSISALVNLKTYYITKNDKSKVEEINQKIEALRK